MTVVDIHKFVKHYSSGRGRSNFSVNDLLT